MSGSRLLYRQFGADPAKSNDKFTILNFRTDCLRELKKNKWAWTDLHYHTVTAALVLSPRRIAPSQLRLVEITYLALRIWLKQQRADADQ